jgi:cyclopropane fatty-acyl-phospholipid synthase-like methyltransferase
VLDVACGAGRNAVCLARHGFMVTAIDIAATALARLAERARAEGLRMRRRCVDLDDASALNGLGWFDDLVVIRYNPSPEQWQRLLARLRPGGRILLCSFGPEDHLRHGTRRQHCLWPDVLDDVLAGTAVLVHERFEQNGRCLEGWIREKEPGSEP